MSDNFEVQATVKLEPFCELKIKCSTLNFAVVEIRGTELSRFVNMRDLHISEAEVEPEEVIVVDANGAWLLNKDKIMCYQAARLVYGKSVYESSLKKDNAINCIVIFNGKYKNISIKKSPEISLFGTTTSRLEIEDAWLDMKIVSEVFVIQTWRGYAPAILVQTPTKEILHVIVGAKSFSSGLEVIRLTCGQIINENISVRKLGKARTSLYEVKHRRSA